MHSLTTRTVLAFLLLLTGATANAVVDSDWNAGQQAFLAGDYHSALIFFESARDTGLDSPAVHYNIAVSQFQLGDYAASRETFTLVRRRFPPMRGLAEYNLGLIALRLDNEADARAHFLNAYRHSPEERKIRILASRNLRELQPGVSAATRWSGVLGVRAGHDDNVALRDEAGLPAGTTTDSPMTDLFAAFSGPWNGRSGFRFEGNAYLVRYPDADEFNQFQMGGAVFYDWRPNDWRIQLALQGSALALNGDAYDRKVGPRVRVIRYLGAGSSIDLRYTFDDVSEGEDRFAAISGERQRVDARYHWYRDGHRAQFRYRREINDRLDPSVSPERSQVGFNYWYQPERGLGFEAGVDFRQSEYDEMATPREEDLLTLRVGLSYVFGDEWRALVEYRNSENDSTDELFSYARSRLMLGLLKTF